MRILFLLGIFFMPPLFADQGTGDFTPSVNVITGPPPFTVSITNLSFGSIIPNELGPCDALIDFNGTSAGAQNGNCPEYSGGSAIGVIQLQGTNPDTDPPTIVTVSGAPSDYLLENGVTQILGSVPLVAADLNGAGFVDCFVRSDMPACGIYLENSFITIPEGAPSGAYTASNAPIEINLSYN